MGQSSKNVFRFGALVTEELVVDDINVVSTNVTQPTSITTAVTLTAPFGIITTQAANAATHGTHTFTANHPSVTANKVVHATIVGYSGTGSPSVRVSTTTGSFNVTIANNHINNPLNAALKIAYSIL